LEAQQGLAFKVQPMTIWAYEVDCDLMCDLTDAHIRAEHGVSNADLSRAWEAMVEHGQTPPSWRLARVFMARNVSAIIVPSFAPGALAGDRNVVFWRWSPGPPCRVTVMEDEARLPKDQSSWR